MSRAADLPRKLGFFDGAALLVGSVIGSGIFVVPTLIAQKVPEPGVVIAIWVFSGLLVLCGALTLAELGAMLPQSGGLYVYMREAYGPFWAFLYGWTIMLVVIPGSMAALTSAFLLYLQIFIPMSFAVEKTIGIAVLLILAFVNARGVKQGAGVQNLFTLLKVAGLALLVVLALVTTHGSASHFLPLAPARWSTGLLTGIGLSMISTLFAYDGWQFVSFMAGEIRDPRRNLPRSIIIGVIIVIVIYVSANLAYIFVLGQARIASSRGSPPTRCRQWSAPSARRPSRSRSSARPLARSRPTCSPGRACSSRWRATACSSRSSPVHPRTTKRRRRRSGRSASGRAC